MVVSGLHIQFHPCHGSGGIQPRKPQNNNLLRASRIQSPTGDGKTTFNDEPNITITNYPDVGRIRLGKDVR